MIRNIIFDWSGTLVDDLPAVWQASNFVFQQAGVREMSLEQFRAEFCLPFKLFYDRYTPHVAMMQLEEWFHGHFRECQHTVVELPHARAFLEFCRQRGLRTFLLSSIHRDHFDKQTTLNGFQAYLDHAYLGVPDKREKIGHLIQEQGLRREETLFVGDMQHDIEAAQRGGVFSCAVLTGYNTLAQLRASNPDLIVEHLGELRSHLENNGMELKSSDPSQQRPVVTVGALIYHPHTGNVLMIRTHKWSNLWGIPGGKIRFGEGSIEALRREIKEETSLDITDIRFALIQDCIHSTEFYRDAHFVLLNYTCRALAPADVKLNEEAEEYRWIPLAKIGALPLNRPTRVLVHAVSN